VLLPVAYTVPKMWRKATRSGKQNGGCGSTMYKRIWALVVVFIVFCPAVFCAAVTIKSSSSLVAPPKDVPILVVSTDPIIQRILSEDISTAGRTTITLAKRAVTLTVTATERPLTPGLTVQQLAPGDPEVGKLLAEAGVDVPALGASADEPGSSNSTAAPGPPMAPLDPQQQQLARYEQSFMPMLGGFGMPGTGMPGTSAPLGSGATGGGAAAGGLGGLASLLGQHGDESQIYDTALVVKAELDQGGKMTLLAIVPPGENLSRVKETLAEKIAGAVLR
jgi:hypothetical protein